MSEDDKLQRIVEARLKLRARFLERMQKTPSLADRAPDGSGPANRHGMPKLPVGQYETGKWPVLDLGTKPDVPLSRWRLEVLGAVE
ncbi:MAG: sulfite oxidase-like oxidoreductase, partial [Myxococcales bacterium]